MKRPILFLIGAALGLIVALWFVLYLQPAREEVTDLETQRETVEATQQQLRTEIARLEQVRDDAPEQDATLGRREVLIPDDAGLPALLRQIQLAASESGVVLRTVSAGRPTPVGAEDDPALQDLSSIQLTLAIEARYFQLIDLLRRFEDPDISGRGMLVETLTLAEEEYPVLNASVTVRSFALTEPSIAPEQPEEGAAEEGAETGEDGAEGGEDGPDGGAGEDETGADGSDAEQEEP
ncbi:MAG: hypothetical protein ACLFS9_08185 [Nitriliruptoraceae bacterium]